MSAARGHAHRDRARAARVRYRGHAPQRRRPAPGAARAVRGLLALAGRPAVGAGGRRPALCRRGQPGDAARADRRDERHRRRRDPAAALGARLPARRGRLAGARPARCPGRTGAAGADRAGTARRPRRWPRWSIRSACPASTARRAGRRGCCSAPAATRCSCSRRSSRPGSSARWSNWPMRRSCPRPLSVGRLIERRLAQLSPRRAGPGAGGRASPGWTSASSWPSTCCRPRRCSSPTRSTSSRPRRCCAATRSRTTWCSTPCEAACRRTVAQHTHARGGGLARAVAGRAGPGGAGTGSTPGRRERALPWLQKAADAALARCGRGVRRVPRTQERDRGSGGQPRRRFRRPAWRRPSSSSAPTASTPSRSSTATAWTGLASTPAQRCEALLQRGHLLQQQGRFEAAIAALRAGRPAAMPAPGRCGSAGPHAISSCLRVCASRPRTRGPGAPVGLHGLVRRAGRRTRTRRELHGETASLYDNLGRLDDALTYHRLCLDLLRKGDRLVNLGTAYGNLACNRIDAGDLLDADRALQQAQQTQAAADGSANVGTTQVVRALHAVPPGSLRGGSGRGRTRRGLDAPLPARPPGPRLSAAGRVLVAPGPVGARGRHPVGARARRRPRCPFG